MHVCESAERTWSVSKPTRSSASTFPYMHIASQSIGKLCLQLRALHFRALTLPFYSLHTGSDWGSACDGKSKQKITVSRKGAIRDAAPRLALPERFPKLQGQGKA